MKQASTVSQTPRPRPDDRKPVVMVSSTVYGIQSLLDQIYATLEGHGYTVLMSRSGTIFPDPTKSPFCNCLEAVNECDLFLGIITPSYGSGKFKGAKSITHQEMDLAVKTKPFRWFMADYRVDIARQLLKQFRLKRGGWRKGFKFEETPVLEDLRIIDMYEAAAFPKGRKTADDVRWVQTFHEDAEALRHVNTIFADKSRILALLENGASQ